MLEAAAAPRLLDAHAEVALLFTEVVIPDVSGCRLADGALRRPAPKVLPTTGCTRDAAVRNGVLDPGMALIGEPFTLDEFAAEIREVLDAMEPGGLG